MTQQTKVTLGKRDYSKPSLVIFGEFANLTAGGTGSVVEIGNQGSKRRP